MDLAKAANLSEVVGQASVAKGAKVACVNYRLLEGFEELDAVLNKALLRDGKRQTEAPAPKPAAQALRKAVKGGGKGSGK